VMPLCGAYGQVIMISEASLTALQISGGAKFAHEVLSEHYNTIRFDDHLEAWNEHIAREIARSDFAVFDWRVEVSSAMVWEFEQAMTVLPFPRIMVLYDSETEDRVRQILAETCGPAARDILVLRVETGPHLHLKPLPWFVSANETTLRKALRKRLSKLKAEPRPAEQTVKPAPG
jgi:hypothetical protein